LKKKITFILFLSFIVSLSAQPEFSSISSKAGAFSRMGFGARGIGMGNAMSAITTGELNSYYNPALNSFQEGNSFHTSYSFLSLDRNLNFVNFTKKFGNGEGGKAIPGISVGIINAGVDNIDGRDSQGNKFDDLSTSENQFFLSLSNRFSNKLALGVSFKFYYYKLYEDVTASGLGFDIGALYLLNENITISFMISDINSKYEWDTSNLYGSSGNTTTDKFPVLKKIGISYKLNDPNIIAAVEFENSNAETNYIRVGAEYNVFENLYFRAGVDKINISNFDVPVRPAAGFSYFDPLSIGVVGINYAFAIEPYSSFDQHIVGLNINF
jgi:hypothetical protein